MPLKKKIVRQIYLHMHDVQQNAVCQLAHHRNFITTFTSTDQTTFHKISQP
jgi:hypothetical protein